MDKYQTLKNLIDAEETLVMPDAYDPISARLIEYAGFKAVQCSGYSFSVSRCYRQESDVSFDENIAISKSIASAVRVPVMADGEDGFGDGEELKENLKAYIRIGMSGINIEDQNLRAPATGVKIIEQDRMIAKLKDAIQTKQEAGCPQFIINARTDALKSVENRREALKIAIDRANRYLEAGADLCFVTYVATLEEVRLLAREIAGPLSIAAGLPYNIGEFSVGDCCKLGIARVSLPNYVIFSALQAMLKGLKLIYETKDFSESVRGELVFSDMRMLQDLLPQ